MTESLRPMNLGGILDRGVQIIREHFALFIGLGAIPGLAQFAGAIAAIHPPSPATDPNATQIALTLLSYGASFVIGVAKIVLQAVATAAICLAASKVNLGETITVREAFGAFTARKGSLVGLVILQGIFAVWPLIVVTLIAVPLAASGAPAFLQVPLWILGSVPCIVLYCRYALAYPAAAIEGRTAMDAINRSVGLGQGGRWRICGGIIVPLVPPFLVTVGAAGLVEFFKSYSPLLAGSPLAEAGANGVVALLTDLVFTPYSAIVLTLLYYDQRIRKEGFDIERMMDAAGLNATVTPPNGGEPTGNTTPEEGQA